MPQGATRCYEALRSTRSISKHAVASSFFPDEHVVIYIDGSLQRHIPCHSYRDCALFRASNTLLSYKTYLKTVYSCYREDLYVFSRRLGHSLTPLRPALPPKSRKRVHCFVCLHVYLSPNNFPD